jgi:hypothetical protein
LDKWISFAAITSLSVTILDGTMDLNFLSVIECGFTGFVDGRRIKQRNEDKQGTGHLPVPVAIARNEHAYN